MRIFKRDRFTTAQTEFLQHQPIEIGFGFGRRRVAAAGEEFEMRVQPEALEMAFDMVVAGVAGDREVKLGDAGRIEQRDDTGEHGLPERAGPVVLVTLLLERSFVGAGAERAPRVKCVIVAANCLNKFRSIERLAMRGVDVAVGVNERRLGVEDEAVEIKNECANHPSDEIARTPKRKRRVREGSARRGGLRLRPESGGRFGWSSKRVRVEPPMVRYPMPPQDPEQASWFASEVQPHETALRAYLRAQFSSLTDPDDVVQETYARLLRARERGPIESPRGLLFATARNAARDLLRRRAVAQTFPITETDELHVFDDAPDVSETVSRRQETDLLGAAIAELPPRCREILVLRKFENLSHREIAQRLGIAEHTVEAQLTKALHRCEDFFARHGLPPK